jgi:flagellar basal body L-ring protein FlgH
MGNARSALSVVVASLLAMSASIGAAQKPPATPSHQHEQMQQKAAKPGASAKMTMDCQQMMQAHQKMMDDMKAMDARLDTLVQQMNSATGQAKVDATAAVVSELVTQRKTMFDRMEGMHGEMMRHMMEHMQAGGADAMMKCPMMQMMHKPK